MAGRRKSGNRTGWRNLGLFWLAILTSLLACAGYLAWLGPPGAIEHPVIPREASVPPARQIVERETEPAIVIASPRPVLQVAVGRDTPGPVADPDPALLEPAGEQSKQNLPRIASDGR